MRKRNASLKLHCENAFRCAILDSRFAEFLKKQPRSKRKRKMLSERAKSLQPQIIAAVLAGTKEEIESEKSATSSSSETTQVSAAAKFSEFAKPFERATTKLRELLARFDENNILLGEIFHETAKVLA